MKARQTVVAAVAFGLPLTACRSLESLAPSAAVALAVAPPGTPLEALEAGRRIYAGACTACHSAEPIDRYSLAEWHEIVGDMADRAKLDPAEHADLLRYIAAARKVQAARN